MGQKSKAKKQKNKSQAAKAAQVAHKQPAAVAAIKEVMPASLSGEAKATLKKSTLDMQTNYIRSDILRIVILLVVVGVILGALAVLNNQTSYLQDTGHHITKFLRLQ